jgi:PHD/YefM family antitoxin component YafN of YafNO toxin-antitoxin module
VKPAWSLLVRNARYRRCLAARLSSTLGSTVAPLGLAFAVLESGGGAATLGLVLTTGMAVFIVITPAAGVLADRLPRVAIIIGCQPACALTQAVAAALVLGGAAQTWSLAVLAALTAAAACFQPAAKGAVPQLVDAADLVPANALLQIAGSTASTARRPAGRAPPSCPAPGIVPVRRGCGRRLGSGRKQPPASSGRPAPRAASARVAKSILGATTTSPARLGTILRLGPHRALLRVYILFMDRMSLTEGRHQLGEASTRAKHAHTRTVFTRQGVEESVLISIDEYRRLLWQGLSREDRDYVLDQHARTLAGQVGEFEVEFKADTVEALVEQAREHFRGRGQ